MQRRIVAAFQLALTLTALVPGCNSKMDGAAPTTARDDRRAGMRLEAKSEERRAEPQAIAAAPEGGKDYAHVAEHEFVAVADDPRSTFSIDVDTASYSNVRRMINDGTIPPADAVRIEELVNYFDYDYPAPSTDAPFSMTSEVASCPWNAEHQLVHIGLQGARIDESAVPARNLVFLLDVSGSMNSPDKLPLLMRGLGMLVDTLRAQDKVSIVVYAGASGVVLEPTSDKAEILAALDRLEAGGSTNGGAGIELAYRLAEKSFVQGGINRVILATDGDFNVGTTGQGALEELITEKRASGVFLSVLGFGDGNLKDSTMELLADKGNGNYAYIDSIAEARKVLVTEAGATLVTIAKDVKIQVEMNPKEVAAFRLIGYENRALAHTDFNDDSKDAGEIGAGHSVTALYEVIPVGAKDAPAAKIDALEYQSSTPKVGATTGAVGELMNVKIRYKQPEGEESKLLAFAIDDADRTAAAASESFRFSAAVAEWGMLLRDSKHKGASTWAGAIELAEHAIGKDDGGYRKELVELMRRAQTLSERKG